MTTRTRPLVSLLLVAMSAVSQGTAAQTAMPQGNQAGAATQAPTARPLEELGIEFVALRLTASDFMVDLRYRVKDVAKAQQLLEKKVQPVLVNEATGERYYVPQAPKVGSLRQSATAKQPAQLDKVYFMLFANPDRKLRVGERVTLYAGDSMVKGLLVQ
jgi:hypothetical protein